MQSSVHEAPPGGEGLTQHTKVLQRPLHAKVGVRWVEVGVKCIVVGVRCVEVGVRWVNVGVRCIVVGAWIARRSDIDLHDYKLAQLPGMGVQKMQASKKGQPCGTESHVTQTAM